MQHDTYRAGSRSRREHSPKRQQIVAMVLGTYREMPGLSLLIADAVRLFGLPLDTCRAVLDHLVAAGTLRRTDRGHYQQAGDVVA